MIECDHSDRSTGYRAGEGLFGDALYFRVGDLPRLSPESLLRLWKEQKHRIVPFLGLADLIETKKTNREKDYAVSGELARLTSTVDEKLMYSQVLAISWYWLKNIRTNLLQSRRNDRY